MAASVITIYRNYTSTDTTVNQNYREDSQLPTIAALGWEREGYTFTGYNTLRDGSGMNCDPGEYPSGYSAYYAQWQEDQILPTYYKTSDQELTSIADAIRAKGGTSAGLTYPAGFVSAINAIRTGGGAETYELESFYLNTIGAPAFSLDGTGLDWSSLSLDGSTFIWLEFTNDTQFTVYLDSEGDDDFSYTIPAGTIAMATTKYETIFHCPFVVHASRGASGFISLFYDPGTNTVHVAADNPLYGNLALLSYKGQNGAIHTAYNPFSLNLHVVRL